jgi:hypothetical protein
MTAIQGHKRGEFQVSEKSNWKSCGGGWSVNLDLGAAEHESGFRLEFSGHPGSRNFDVQPSGIPSTIGALEWAGLLREGTDEYRRAFAREEGPIRDESFGEAPKLQARKPVITVKRKRQIS